MYVYLAARYGRRLELCHYQALLAAEGITVTSRWLLGTPEADNNGTEPIPQEVAARCAQEDLADIAAAQWLLAFTEPPCASASRGGRHVELGVALAWHKTIAIIGPRENIFCALPYLYHYDTLTAWIAAHRSR